MGLRIKGMQLYGVVDIYSVSVELFACTPQHTTHKKATRDSGFFISTLIAKN